MCHLVSSLGSTFGSAAVGPLYSHRRVSACSLCSHWSQFSTSVTEQRPDEHRDEWSTVTSPCSTAWFYGRRAGIALEEVLQPPCLQPSVPAEDSFLLDSWAEVAHVRVQQMLKLVKGERWVSSEILWISANSWFFLSIFPLLMQYKLEINLTAQPIQSSPSSRDIERTAGSRRRLTSP